MPLTADSTLAPAQMLVLSELYEIIDPELGINIVDLGLVRTITFLARAVTLTMTLTSPACPLTDVIEDEVETRLLDLELCESVAFVWEFVPPWNFAAISADGRDQLRALGMPF